eukprot:7442343-Pyramimonas_sp.AAC.1
MAPKTTPLGTHRGALRLPRGCGVLGAPLRAVLRTIVGPCWDALIAPSWSPGPSSSTCAATLHPSCGTLV